MAGCIKLLNTVVDGISHINIAAAVHRNSPWALELARACTLHPYGGKIGAVRGIFFYDMVVGIGNVDRIAVIHRNA